MTPLIKVYLHQEQQSRRPEMGVNKKKNISLEFKNLFNHYIDRHSPEISLYNLQSAYNTLDSQYNLLEFLLNTGSISIKSYQFPVISYNNMKSDTI